MKRHLLYSLTLLLAVGISGTALAQGTPAGPGDVVINKAMNKGSNSEHSQDAIELLVITDHVDLRGCYIKDFSSSGGSDEGSAYRFSATETSISDLRSGTLIVLTNGNPSTVDLSYNPAGGDWLIQASMPDALTAGNLFASGTGGYSEANFRLGNDDILMILEASESNPLGSDNFIHAFLYGFMDGFETARPAIATWLAGTGAGTPVLEAPGTDFTPDATSNEIVYATTPNTNAADYNSGLIDAIGSPALSALAAEGTVIDGTALAFGTGNNATNRNYISALRSVLSVEPPFAKRNNFELTASPNPVAVGANVTLTFTLAASERVSFDLVDFSGKKVAQLQGATQLAAGDHEINLTIPSAATADFGVFLVHMKSQSGNEGYARVAVYR